MNKKKILLYTALTVSLCFNVLVVYYDVVPTLYPLIKQKYIPTSTLADENINISNVESKTYEAAKKMLTSEHSVSVWQENKGFTTALLQKRSITSTKEFQLNNYPTAFLLNGLFDYSTQLKDKSEFYFLKNYLDKNIIDNNAYEIIRIDQAPLGLIALKLFQSTQEQKYLLFAQNIFLLINSLLDSDGLLSYRDGQTTFYYDSLGLAIPFLIEYAKTVDEKALNIARDQLVFYTTYGLHSNSFIPSHGINKQYKTPVGSSNWGRGIGWYFLGLSSFHKTTGEFGKEYLGLLDELQKLKNEYGLWGQFPGSKNEFDASTTLLFIYAESLNNHSVYTKNELLDLLAPYITSQGELLRTSGDTYSANYYSSTFGKSEFSQGLLLSLISNL